MEKNKIIQILKGETLDFVSIIKKLQEPSDTVEKALLELENRGIVFFDGKEYALCEDHNIYLGTIVTRKRVFAFVQIAGYKNDFRLGGSFLKGLIGGDRIYVTLANNETDCHFAGFYKRKEKLIGTLAKKPRKGFYILSPDLDESDVRVKFSNAAEDFGAEDGDMIQARVDDYNATEIYCTITKLLVKKTDVGSDISKIILTAEAPLVFDDEVMKEAGDIPQELKEIDYQGREDFRRHLIVTIDGQDALDFDDAVEVRRITNGYEIGVHIADVSNYVIPGSPIDLSAYERGTSIYVADRVVPMLPTALSNGICSLNPDVDRLTMSVIMNVDNYGNVYQSRLTRGVIRSQGRLTYTQVNNLLAGNEGELSKDIQDMLLLSHEVTAKIRKRREKNGALKLDSTELKYNLDQYNNPLEVIKREQGQGEKLIEDLMIIANVAVAGQFAKLGISSLYRIHEDPPSKKIEELKAFLLKTHLSEGFPAEITPLSLEKWLSSIQDEDLRAVASNQLLRSLAKARYSPDNTGHFGLSEEDYLHFTSPIRRYPDLIVHRLVKQYLLDEHDVPLELNEYLAEAGDHLSMTERRAQKIERDVESLLAAKYMSKRIGETYQAVITSLMPYGMYCELDNGIDVLLPYGNIDEDVYVYEEDGFQVRGQENGNIYTIGKKLELTVFAIDMDRKEIKMCTPYFYQNREEFLTLPNENRFYRQDRERSYSRGRSYGENNSHEGRYRERQSYGHREDFSEERSYRGQRPAKGRSYESHDSAERRPYGRKSAGDKSRYSEKRTYGDREFSSSERSYERRPYGHRNSTEHRTYTHKSYGDQNESSGKRSYRDRDSSDRRNGYSEKRSYSNRGSSFEGRSYSRRPDNNRDSSERRSSSQKTYGERGEFPKRKSYGRSTSGENRSYSSNRPQYRNDHSGNSRKPMRNYGERKNRR